MKRKATRFLALTMSAVLVTSLTACGDGSDENAKDAVTPVEAQPMLSELELEILNLETKYNKGEFTQEDYLTLADAYNRAGYIRKQRDMLEQDYRLYADEEAFAALQELSVNLEEETEGIRSRAQEMQNDLELTEYLSESVNLIDSEDWFTTMMQTERRTAKLLSGKRQSASALCTDRLYGRGTMLLQGVVYRKRHETIPEPGGCNDPAGNSDSGRCGREHRGSGRN